MSLLSRIAMHAAQKMASDPRVRAKATELFEREVKPRAAAAWQQARPKVVEAEAELRAIMQETDPREDPRAFVGKVRDRVLRRDRSQRGQDD